MTYTEEDYLQLSGIQHYMYCKRQWALIHIEQLWLDDARTTEGNLFHKNADNPNFIEKRGLKTIRRSVHVSSSQLGLSGTCDVVEFYSDKEGNLTSIIPIEYKVGRRKTDLSDKLQLCAETISLEEMYGHKIDLGYLYYGLEKTRIKVDMTEELKMTTLKTSEEMHELFSKGHIPAELQNSKCKNCSLFDACMPKKSKQISINKYIDNILEEYNEKIT